MPDSTPNVPDHTQRYIVWDTSPPRVVYLVGYCPATLGYFNTLFADAQDILSRHTDLSLDPNEAICTKVRESRFCKGFTLLICPIHGFNLLQRPLAGLRETTWQALGLDAF